MTLENVGEEMFELIPELARYVAPAETLDKPVYSPWWSAPSCLGGFARGTAMPWSSPAGISICAF
jgi:hypothetical protein